MRTDEITLAEWKYSQQNTNLFITETSSLMRYLQLISTTTRCQACSPAMSVTQTGRSRPTSSSSTLPGPTSCSAPSTCREWAGGLRSTTGTVQYTVQCSTIQYNRYLLLRRVTPRRLVPAEDWLGTVVYLFVLTFCDIDISLTLCCANKLNLFGTIIFIGNFGGWKSY